MFIKTIIIGTGCALATEILFKPEEQRLDVERQIVFPLPSLTQSVYNIQTTSGPILNMITESRLVTI